MNDAGNIAMADAGGSQDQLSQRDFNRLAGFIQDYSGIRMPPNKVTLVEGRLRRRVRALGMPSLAQYCRHLFDEGGMQAEAVHLIDAVTTNKTDFFREPEHFRVLRDMALPQLLTGRRATGPATIKLWSAASSTGSRIGRRGRRQRRSSVAGWQRCCMTA